MAFFSAEVLGPRISFVNLTSLFLKPLIITVILLAVAKVSIEEKLIFSF